MTTLPGAAYGQPSELGKIIAAARNEPEVDILAGNDTLGGAERHRRARSRDEQEVWLERQSPFHEPIDLRTWSDPGTSATKAFEKARDFIPQPPQCRVRIAPLVPDDGDGYLGKRERCLHVGDIVAGKHRVPSRAWNERD